VVPSGTGTENLLRELAPQVLGALVRGYGHFDTAEDAVQEALLAAAQQWPREGVPDNPRGWLIRVASRRMTDQLRSEQARRRREETAWADRIPAVVHVDGTARAQTVDPGAEPEVAALLAAFERRTGLPCLVNTSLNTAGRPMVDDPRDALELFGSAPVDVLVLGPYLVRRPRAEIRR
jgi:hypothetical protein